jgi:hypothetical protein
MILVVRVRFAALCAFFCAQAIVLASPQRSVSTSRQFLVYGADLRLRGAICDLAERTKREVLRVIDQRDEWVTPIVVDTHYPQANWPERPRAALIFSQTGFGLKLQLDLTIASDANQPEIRHELLRAILLEMLYRHKTDVRPGAAYVPPPDWLLVGIPLQQAEIDAPRWADLLRAPVAAKKVLPLVEVLRQRYDQLDESGRSLYRAYSFALVQFLTGTPDARARLARFVADLPAASNDPMADLGRHFPALGNAKAAEKAWSSLVTALTAAPSFQWVSAEEANRKLDEILVVGISTAGVDKKYQLEEFPKFIRSASAKVALVRCSRELSILAARANSIYRPMICEYASIAMLLARDKTRGMAERLARLSASRRSISARIGEIEDYLNWFEVTKSREMSGAFDGYRKAAEAAAQPGPRRGDPISVYVDVLEAEFQD